MGKIPQYAIITKAIAVLVTDSSDANHTLKLVLSTDSSGTDNAALADTQDMISSDVLCWAGTGDDGANANINCASGAGVAEKAAYAAVATGADSGLSTLDTSAADNYIYLAFADTSHTGGDGNPSTAPVVNVLVEYAGID